VNVVEVRRLTRSFGGSAALAGLSFTVPRGGVTALLGPNGAGKSTTLRVLLGLVRPDGGEARVFGEDVRHPHRYLRRVGAVIEGPTFQAGLSGRDNLRVQARLAGLSDRAVDQALERVGFSDRAKERAGRLSLGQRQRLGLAAALLGEPALLLLDEPQNGLDPDGVAQLRHLLQELGSSGVTVVLSSHALAEVERVAQRLVVLRGGVAVYEGEMAALREAAGSDLVIEVDDGDDLPRVVELAQHRGHLVRRDGAAILIRGGPLEAAELNRAAHDLGVTLRRIEHRTPSLEDLFQRLQRGGAA
jgi:ABC-2 type transport system ATP-binding protein